MRDRPIGQPSDSGFTLVETVIALLVFTLLSSGVIASAVTITRMSADDRSREIATNLAAQATDAVRLAADPFQVLSASTTFTSGGRTYTVARKAVWVSSSGSDTGCTGSANLIYKRVAVTVTWTGQLATTAAVRSDTMLATRSNTTDASDGAVLVSVVDSTGAPLSGAAVTITPAGSGTALTTQPAATDSDGCSYAGGVATGVYTVAISRSSSVDAHQTSGPTSTVSVAAGATVSTAFQYDSAAAYTINHASNSSASPLLPTNLQTTLIPVVGTDTVYPVLTSSAATTASAWATSSGYVAIAGAATSTTGASQCSAFDPAAWPAGTSSGTALAAGTRPAAAAAAAGGGTTVGEKMGVLTVKASGTGYLFASMPASSAVSGGNPGCTVTTTYAFGNVLTNGTVTIALPYGAWALSSTTSSGTATAVLTSATTVTNVVSTTTAASNKTVAVVLDPRARS